MLRLIPSTAQIVLTWHQKLDALAELTAPSPAVHAGIAMLLSLTMFVAKAPAAPWIASALGPVVGPPGAVYGRSDTSAAQK